MVDLSLLPTVIIIKSLVWVYVRVCVCVWKEKQRKKIEPKGGINGLVSKGFEKYVNICECVWGLCARVGVYACECACVCVCVRECET